MTTGLPVSSLLLHRHCLSSLFFTTIFLWNHILYFLTQKAISHCYYLKYGKTWCLSCSQHMTSKRKRGKKAEGFNLESQGNTAKNSIFYMHLISLEQPESFVTLSLSAQITCIQQTMWDPPEGTPGHPTATLWDQWPPCNTPISLLWLETKVLKTGVPQGQGCSCWVASRVLDSVLTPPGSVRRKRRPNAIFLHWCGISWDEKHMWKSVSSHSPQVKCPGRSCCVPGKIWDMESRGY